MAQRLYEAGLITYMRTDSVNLSNEAQQGALKQIESKFGLKVAAMMYPFRKFWIAEKYHQDFKKNNPNHPYIKNVSNPRFDNFKFKFEEFIKN